MSLITRICCINVGAAGRCLQCLGYGMVTWQGHASPEACIQGTLTARYSRLSYLKDMLQTTTRQPLRFKAAVSSLDGGLTGGLGKNRTNPVLCTATCKEAGA